MNGSQILVVGGGIGGLAVALALAKAGFQTVVVERSSDQTEHSAGVQLSPNATKALRSLGCLEAIEKQAFEPEAIEMRDGITGQLLVREHAGASFVARYGSPYLQVHRTVLHNALLVAARHEGVDVQFGKEMVAINHSSDGVVATFSDGSNLPCTGLIGADGLGSTVRRLLFGAERPRFTGQIAWRAVVPSTPALEGLLAPVAGAWLGDHQHFVHYFIDAGASINLVGVTENAEPGVEGWQEVGAAHELVTAFQSWALPVRALAQAAVHVRRWPLFDRAPLASWCLGRTSLLGDACHPMLPFLAQGAGMALEDAVVLARCVTQNPKELDSAFSAYARLRQARTARVQAAARRNATLFHLQGALSRTILGGALSLGATLAPGTLSIRQDWLYGYDSAAA